MTPSVARRRSCSPRRLGSRAPPSGREVADRRPQRTYASGRRRRRTRLHQPPAQKSSTPDPPSRGIRRRGDRARQLRRAASAGAAEGQRQSSVERRRRRGRPPPAKEPPGPPPPPWRHQQQRNAHLHYLCTRIRRFPVLPPPERRRRAGNRPDLRRGGGASYGSQKSPSFYCRRGRETLQGANDHRLTLFLTAGSTLQMTWRPITVSGRQLLTTRLSG